MDIIRQIEKLIGIKLKTVPIEEIIDNFENCIAKGVIGQVVGLNLNLTKINDISFLNGLDGLTHLSLIGNKITDLTPLSSLTNLKALYLTNNNITDLTPLCSLTHLKTLRLENNKITELTPLSSMNQLATLYLRDNEVTDLTPLSPLKNLTALYLENNKVTDLTPLSPMTHLKVLYLGFNNVTDLTPLHSLKNLTALNLENNNVTNITPLSPLTNLTILYLENNRITNLIPLSHLNHLTTLYLRDNSIRDITPLCLLKNLTVLYLENNNIYNITPLRSLTHLAALSLRDNNVIDLTPLQPLKNLKTLRLENNNVTDLTPLRYLTNLTALFLRDNEITDLTPLRPLTKLTILSLNDNEINDITPLRPLTKLTILSLNDNGINDITPLRPLKKLTILSLNNNGINDITPLNHLKNLTTLSLGFNNIIDLTPLRPLINLRTLRLENNNITDLAPLNHLKNLTTLSLGFNNITDLASLNHLKNLATLYLGFNKVTDLTPLSPMTHLKVLYLGFNNVTDLTPLSVLKNLKTLYLGSNNITDLTPLITLTNLIILRLEKNNITNLTPLSTLTNLTTLYLEKNSVTDLTPLSSLTHMKVLWIYENKITDLAPLQQLKHMKILNARKNNIERLPCEITTWWPNMKIIGNDREGLHLKDNPLTDPPIEIFKQGYDAVLNYFAEIEQESVLFLECKLLLVGSGDVGKTTLMKKLKDNSFQVKPGTEDTTRGIDIQTWTLNCTFPDGQSRDVNIHFWDFGGQEILHATHQFFLTKRSLYLFVWEARKEEEIQSFDYWLNAVRLLGASSPVIVVMNKSELRIKQIAESSLKDKFPNIAKFIQVSCVSGHSIPELTQTIRTTLSRMQHLLGRLPKRWIDIRDELNKLNCNYISLDDYFKICSAHQMNQEKAKFLSDYLHDLGIILNFRTDPLLTDTVILKSEWATGAVYALIDSLNIQKNNGKFNRAQLPQYWKNELYPTDKHSLLLRLMEKFELCFNIVGTDDYIIPELLQAERNDIDHKAYRSTGNLHLHYSYDFMPAGIVTRFITRIHYLILNEHYWKNGVELEFNKSYALIVSDPVQKRIKISVCGENPVQLMAIIRSHFDHIHETLNMEKDEHVFEEVPCICSQCATSEKPYFHKYRVLQVLMSMKKSVLCEKSFEDVSTHRLLNGLLPPEKTKNLFDTVITVVSQVQGISKTLQSDENSRNTVVSLLLGTRGYRVKDQTLWGVSATGKGMGELDVKIEDEKGRTVFIIEALNLSSFNTSEIDRHVKKIFEKYDCSGLKENYILVYATVKDFDEFCRKYREHIEHVDYESYPLLEDGIEEEDTGLNKINAVRARHQCYRGKTVLNHIIVAMQ